MKFNSIEYELIHLAIHRDFLVSTWLPSARNNLLIVVNHKMSPCCDLGGGRGEEKEKRVLQETPSDNSIARLTWNTAYSSG